MDLSSIPSYVAERQQRSISNPNGIELIASNDEKLILSQMQAYGSGLLKTALEGNSEDTKDWSREKYEKEPLSIVVIPFNLDVKVSVDILTSVVEFLKHPRNDVSFYELKIRLIRQLISTKTPDFIIRLIHAANYFEIPDLLMDLIKSFLDSLSDIHANDIPALLDWKLDQKAYSEQSSHLSHQPRRVEELYPTFSRPTVPLEKIPLSTEQKKFPIPGSNMSYIIFDDVLMMTEEKFDSDESFIFTCRNLEFLPEKDFTQVGEAYMFTEGKFTIFLLQIPDFSVKFNTETIYDFRRVKEIIEMKEIPKEYQYLIDTYRKQVIFNALWTHPNMYFDIINIIMENMKPYYYGNHKCLLERVAYPELIYLNINIGKYAICVDRSYSTNYAVNLLTGDTINLMWKKYPESPNLFPDENHKNTKGITYQNRESLYGVISIEKDNLHFYGWTRGKMDKQLEILNIKGVQDSKETQDSKGVQDSKETQDSKGVQDSKETQDSKGVQDSKEVRGSKEVRDSKRVQDKTFMSDINFEVKSSYGSNLSIGELHITSNRIVMLLTNFKKINVILIYDYSGNLLKELEIPERGKLIIDERYLHVSYLWFDLYLLKNVPIPEEKRGQICSNGQQIIIFDNDNYSLYNDGKTEELPLLKSVDVSTVDSFENKKIIFCGPDESKDGESYIQLYDIPKGHISKLIDVPVSQPVSLYFANSNNVFIDAFLKGQRNHFRSVSHIDLDSGIGHRIDNIIHVFHMFDDGFIYTNASSETYKYSIYDNSYRKFDTTHSDEELFDIRDINRFAFVGSNLFQIIV